MEHRQQQVKGFVCALGLLLLAGCYPYPHTTLRSEKLTGTVLDARTHRPIKGAKVVQSEGWEMDRPKRRTRTTDAQGRFKLPASHNFHLGIIGVEGNGWPPGYRYQLVTISYPNYLSYVTGGSGHTEVLLQPVSGLDLQGTVVDLQNNAPIKGAFVGLGDYPALSCMTDARGHFHLAAGTGFYDAYAASTVGSGQGHPFRDWVEVDRGDYGGNMFHWGALASSGKELRLHNIIVQPER
jgi:hypothetical protein